MEKRFTYCLYISLCQFLTKALAKVIKESYFHYADSPKSKLKTHNRQINSCKNLVTLAYISYIILFRVPVY